MKQKITRLAVVLLTILLAIPVLAHKEADNLPLDPAVRIGKLKNGLTYYIRRNTEPENKVNFYIAQKVGSIQEEDTQRGLAHFLEHMCFNGTEHFPGKGLINYLETIGVKFGVNLNAYTSIDETVYNINNVPANVDGAVDSCLWILHDWADGLTLDGEEIDNERGVIHEEWRQRSSAVLRMYDKVLPIVYQGEKYAYRMPIGIMEVVDSFPHQDLRDYYEKWYRPDLQGIVVVGDIDVDDVEKKIKKIFKGIKKAKNPAERVYYSVSDNEEMIFAHATDKEQQNYALQLYFKHDATPRELANTKEEIYKDYVIGCATSMLNTRFSEISLKENPPYLAAGVGNSSFMLSNTKDAFFVMVMCNVENINASLPLVFCEVERAKRYGFTEGELERLKASTLASIEKQYAERDKTTSIDYALSCVRNFLDNADMMSPEMEYEFTKEMVNKVTLDEINAVLPTFMTKKNRVAVVFAPENDSVRYPVKEDIEMLLSVVEAAPIDPYVDTMSDASLLDELPVPGSIVAIEDGVWNSTVWTLSNGIKVVVKPTDFAADEVTLVGNSYGGTSRYPDCDRVNLALLGSTISLGGVGSFDAMQLKKKMAGSTAHVNVSVSSYLDNVSASCSPRDMEDMFRLLYLKFTAPRKDTTAFESFKTRMIGSLKDRDIKPNTALGDSVNKALYNGHPRTKPLLAQDIDSADYDRIMALYEDRVADAGDFTFVLVGNIDTVALRPLVEQYLASLPATGRNEQFVDNGLYVRKGVYANNFSRKMETPMGTEIIIYSGDMDYNPRNSILMSYLEQIMTMVYTSEVREKEGGTYGVGVSGNLDRLPKGEFSFMIQFSMSPERREELTNIIVNEFEKVAKNGPDDEHIEKVRSYMLKTLEERVKKNSFWSSILMQYYFAGMDFYSDYRNIVEGITKEDIRIFLSDMLKQGNFIEVSMVPEY